MRPPQDVDEGCTELTLHDCAAGIERIAKHRRSVVQIATHSGELRALTGEQECNACSRLRSGLRNTHGTIGDAAQLSHGVRTVACHDGVPSPQQRRTRDGCGVREICKR